MKHVYLFHLIFYSTIILIGLDKNIGALGITLELCAGIVDKEGKSRTEIAQEEIEEEVTFLFFPLLFLFYNYSKVGYAVESNQIEFIQNFRASIGTGGAKMALFYVGKSCFILQLYA